MPNPTTAFDFVELFCGGAEVSNSLGQVASMNTVCYNGFVFWLVPLCCTLGLGRLRMVWMELRWIFWIIPADMT